MSALLVADTTINTVVNWLRRNIDQLPIIAAKLQQLNIDTSAPGWAEDLGQVMFLLNRQAVDARYGDGEAAKLRKHDYRFAHTEPEPAAQVLQSLECWLYQCCEEEVRETELYELFASDVRLYLMRKIIDQLPDYEKAD